VFTEDVSAIQYDVVSAAVPSFDGDVGFEVLREVGRQPVGTWLVVSSLAILDDDIHRGFLLGVP